MDNKIIIIIASFLLGVGFSQTVLKTNNNANIDTVTFVKSDIEDIKDTSDQAVEPLKCPPCSKMKITTSSASIDEFNDDKEENNEDSGDDYENNLTPNDKKSETLNTKVELSPNSTKALNLVKSNILKRNYPELNEDDIKNIKENILKDSAVTAARSKIIKNIERIAPLNGQYKGRHYYLSSSSNEKLNNVYSELEIAFGPSNGDIAGNFKLIFYDNDGKKLSNSTGSGSNGDIFYNEKEKAYLIKFHGGYLLHVTNNTGKVFSGNIYKSGDFVGYASYKKVY